MSLKRTPHEILEAIKRGEETHRKSLEELKKRNQVESMVQDEEETRILQEIAANAKNWIPSALERIRSEGSFELVLGFNWIIPGKSHPFSQYPHTLVYRKLKDMYDSERIMVKTKSWLTTDPDWPNEEAHAVILEIY